PPEMVQLTHLQALDLGSNQITAAPEWLVPMPPLKKLYIANNPITQPPPEILGWALIGRGDTPVDLEAICRYYAQLAKEGEALIYEAKLLLIGEGGAGKTSLACKLMNAANPLPPPDDTTKGIDVYHWNFPVPPDPDLRGLEQPSVANLAGLDYQANIWHFGGQSIYKNTHQFFLSARSVYVLLTDTRRESGDFYDWLRMQEAFGGDSPALILKNQNRRHGNQCIIENLP
ncbi:MAG: hypothetical protein GY803_31925, partial [Chloroflexi bacterium]|nr:hypothetical protein [Chloroflexota bacterium]